MKVAIANLPNRRARGRIASEVEEELQFHIQMLEHKFARHGMSSANAKAAALRRFGNPDRIRRQCIEISRRNSPLRRALKRFSILLIVIGVAINNLASDYKVARIGEMLIMIAISGRLLLYVRGLTPFISILASKQASLTIFPDRTEDRSN